MENHLTLLELNSIVRTTIESRLAQEYWVETEISECREHNGHCYMELVEKDPLRNTPIAKASAKCWRSSWGAIKPRFIHVTGSMPQPGMKLLMRVMAQFHEAYGFSWIVTDIDPTYTLGDMARRRQEILRQLAEEGVLELNRQLPLSPFAQRIAVVSSKTAAGFGDFQDQLLGNRYGYKFSITLFQTVLQGEAVEKSVIQSLDTIFASQEEYDAVVIIRGGGATSDLSGFDSLPLAENIANFPLPVITGIGHDRDETVADIVAHTSVKTPTAAAALLIENLLLTDNQINNLAQRLHVCTTSVLETQKQRLHRTVKLLPLQVTTLTSRQAARLDKFSASLENALRNTLERQHHRIEMLFQRTEALDPEKLLRRGYSITTVNGKAVTDSCQLNVGDTLLTRFASGTAKSTVEEIQTRENGTTDQQNTADKKSLKTRI